MQIPLRVRLNDGTVVDVSADTPDVVDFEAEWGRSIVTVFKDGSDSKQSDLLWLAWTSLRRREQTALEWRDWLGTVDMAMFALPETAKRASRRKAGGAAPGPLDPTAPPSD